MPVTLSIANGRSKRDIIELAFDDCGLAGYEFDRSPEEQAMALRKLNALMLEEPWSQLGYLQPEYSSGLPEDLTNLPDWAVNTVAQYLALRIAPGMGATLASEQRAAMSRSLMALQSRLAQIPEMAMPGNTVLGSGSRRRVPYSPAFRPVSDGIDVVTDG